MCSVGGIPRAGVNQGDGRLLIDVSNWSAGRPDAEAQLPVADEGSSHTQDAVVAGVYLPGCYQHIFYFIYNCCFTTDYETTFYFTVWTVSIVIVLRQKLVATRQIESNQIFPRSLAFPKELSKQRVGL